VRSYLFGDAPKSFKDLNASSSICSAVEATGKTSATAIQAAVYGHIATTEKDTVIAAETGSGKTLAYLLPLIDKMILSTTKPANTSSEPRATDAAHDFFPTAVVLVPNKELGEQGGCRIT
jgi:superfamily II DNA/RNA helicase